MIKVAVSGYFDPIHVGHLRMFEEAKELGDYLTVIINSDKQMELKGKSRLMTDADRAQIIGALSCVDEVFLSVDNDKTVRHSLQKLQPDVFANGGDRRNESDIPETEVCKKLGIEMVFNVGGDKVRSSSELIKNLVNGNAK